MNYPLIPLDISELRYSGPVTALLEFFGQRSCQMMVRLG